MLKHNKQHNEQIKINQTNEKKKSMKQANKHTKRLLKSKYKHFQLDYSRSLRYKCKVLQYGVPTV